MRQPGLPPLCPLPPPPCGINMKGLHVPWSRLQGLGDVTQALQPPCSRGAQRFLTCSHPPDSTWPYRLRLGEGNEEGKQTWGKRRQEEEGGRGRRA